VTAKESVFSLLKREKADEEAGDSYRQKQEWIAALGKLMAQVRKWLESAEVETLLTVEEVQLELREPGLGAYTAMGLQLTTPHGKVIHVIPKGRFVVGASGRVDIECGPKKAVLVQVEPGAWQFAQLAAAQGRWTFKDFNEESFWEALNDLLA